MTLWLSPKNWEKLLAFDGNHKDVVTPFFQRINYSLHSKINLIIANSKWLYDPRAIISTGYYPVRRLRLVEPCKQSFYNKTICISIWIFQTASFLFLKLKVQFRLGKFMINFLCNLQGLKSPVSVEQSCRLMWTFRMNMHEEHSNEKATTYCIAYGWTHWKVFAIRRSTDK